MPVITAKTAVVAGGTSAWSATDNESSILVGVEGKGYTVEYDLGSDLIYGISAGAGSSRQGIVVAKAFQVRVRAGASDISYEVFA